MNKIMDTTILIAVLFVVSCASNNSEEHLYIGIVDSELVLVNTNIREKISDCLIYDNIESCRQVVTDSRQGHSYAILYVNYYSYNKQIFSYFGGASAFLSVLPQYSREEAFQNLIALADEGYVPAQSLVGQRLLTATQNLAGIEADPERAVDYLRQATEQNSMLAPLYLALAHDEGRGVPLSHEDATRLYEVALERGQKRAGVLLAQRAIDGDVMEQNLDYAALQLVRAAELGSIPAIQALCEGEGTQINIPMHPLLPEEEMAYWCEQANLLREQR